MQLKRKRSESEFSLASSSASPSKPEALMMTMAFDDADCRPLFASHPSGRTMKRFRNGRPSDDEVHQRTLNMLFTAQRSYHGHHQYPPSPAASPLQHQPTQPRPAAAAAQTSLHSFWNLPRAAPAPAPAADGPLFSPLGISDDLAQSCEDCGGSQPQEQQQQRYGGGDQDMMMTMADDDADAYAYASFQDGPLEPCASCAKRVCAHCSISDLRDDGGGRQCLGCAGRRRGAAARQQQHHHHHAASAGTLVSWMEGSGMAIC